VQLEGVSPSIGPHSGGTQLAITGQFLNIGSKISAFLDELPCFVNATQASSSRLMCITSPAPSSRPVQTLTLMIDGANRTLSNNPFSYKQDPTILEIKPLKSFVSGGRMITVHGTNLNTIQKPEMIVYSDSERNIINKTVSL
jgi:plexin A